MTSIGCLSGDSGSSATMHSCVCVSRVCAFSWGIFFFCHRRTFIWALVHLWPAGCQSFLSKHVWWVSRDSFPDLEVWSCFTVNTVRKVKRLIYIEQKQRRWSWLGVPKSCRNYSICPLSDCPRWQQGSGDQTRSWPCLSGTTCMLWANPISNSLPAICNNGND